MDEYPECFRVNRGALGVDPAYGDAESGYADFDTGDVTLVLFDADEMAEAFDETTRSGRGRDGACVVFRVDDSTGRTYRWSVVVRVTS